MITQTCTTTLALRHMAIGKGHISQLNDLRGPVSEILSELAQQMEELQKYKARFGAL